MTGSRPDYYFDEARSREELEVQAGGLIQDGWKPAGDPRKVELSFPSGRREFRFSQAYIRPALFPACERIRRELPPGFAVLAEPSRAREHLVHFYDRELILMNSLEAFVLRGLMEGEAVVIIALPSHRATLEARLVGHGLNLPKLEETDQLLLVDAQAALSSFLRDGMPNEALFEEHLGGLLARVRARHRTVRAFGEMVGILWMQGNESATIHLEELWHRHCEREGLMLYCAYADASFAAHPEARQCICASHSRVIEA